MNKPDTIFVGVEYFSVSSAFDNIDGECAFCHVHLTEPDTVFTRYIHYDDIASRQNTHLLRVCEACYYDKLTSKSLDVLSGMLPLLIMKGLTYGATRNQTPSGISYMYSKKWAKEINRFNHNFIDKSAFVERIKLGNKYHLWKEASYYYGDKYLKEKFDE